MRFFGINFIGLLFLAVLNSCLPVCTTSFEPGIEIEVFNSTGDNQLFSGIHIVITNGDYIEIVNSNNAIAGTYYLAYERAGCYQVVVSKPGFQTAVIPDVRVREDKCHVETVSLNVNLEAL